MSVLLSQEFRLDPVEMFEGFMVVGVCYVEIIQSCEWRTG